MTKITRYRETYEEVEVPEGYEVCSRCKGKGATSQYDDAGWWSFLHDPRMASLVTCFKCRGEGYTRKDL